MTLTASTGNQWYNKTWLIVLLCLFVLPVGLYALWKTQRLSTGWKIGTTFVLFFMVVAALSNGSQANSKDASTEPATTDAAVKEENKEAKSEPETSTSALFDTPESFKEAFNNYASSNDLDELQITDDLEVKEGEVQNTFQYMFNGHLGVIGTVNKSDGSVKEVTLLGSGDGSFKSGSNIILGMMAIIAAVDPGLKAENRIEILKDLGLLGGKDVDITNLSGKTERNGIKYFISSSEMMGLMFGASRQ